MGKALPIIGIVGAAFAMLLILVLVNAAVFVVLPIILAGSIMLLMQRNTVGAVAGLIVLVLGVVAAMGLAGSITTKDSGSTDFGISEEMGRIWAAAACIAIPLGVVASRWDDVEPMWLSYVGIATGVLSLILAWANRDVLADQTIVMVLVAGALALGPIAPMVGLLRSPHDPAGNGPEPRASA